MRIIVSKETNNDYDAAGDEMIALVTIVDVLRKHPPKDKFGARVIKIWEDYLSSITNEAIAANYANPWRPMRRTFTCDFGKEYEKLMTPKERKEGLHRKQGSLNS